MNDLWARLIALYEEPFFEGPWEGEGELAEAFLAFAARERAELFDEYGDLDNAAYCIELVLGDEEPEEHAAALAAFVGGLDPTLARRARQLIEEDLARRDGDEAADLLATLRNVH